MLQTSVFHRLCLTLFVASDMNCAAMAIATDTLSTPRLRVAISGGGPAGLAAAIALIDKPGFEVTIYEQATELREVGAGLRVGYNSWRVLELLGVADKVHGHIKVDHQHR